MNNYTNRATNNKRAAVSLENLGKGCLNTNISNKLIANICRIFQKINKLK
jgi:hypothetical protein